MKQGCHCLTNSAALQVFHNILKLIVKNTTPPFSSQLPITSNYQSKTHNLLVQTQTSRRTALLNRCFMLTSDVIGSAFSAGHWEKPGIYRSNHNFLPTSLLSPPPTCCREIKFQTSACSQWMSTFKGTYKHIIMLSNWAIFLHFVLIEKNH